VNKFILERDDTSKFQYGLSAIIHIILYVLLNIIPLPIDSWKELIITTLNERNMDMELNEIDVIRQPPLSYTFFVLL
jgi:hypothetical protein